MDRFFGSFSLMVVLEVDIMNVSRFISRFESWL